VATFKGLVTKRVSRPDDVVPLHKQVKTFFFSRLFEAGGASATSRVHNFDRHWRNLRTIFSHNRCCTRRE
jgi:hypothetical protein